MAWLHVLDPKAPVMNSFKVTCEEDLKECNWNCSSLDIFRGNTRLVRVTVKKFINSYDPAFYPVYVYIKLFKWDQMSQAYLKQSQIAMSLHEFKTFRESLGKIDDMIDRVIEEEGPKMDVRPQGLVHPYKQSGETMVGHNDTETTASPPYQEL